jgi:hypothetical protein
MHAPQEKKKKMKSHHPSKEVNKLSKYLTGRRLKKGFVSAVCIRSSIKFSFQQRAVKSKVT